MEVFALLALLSVPALFGWVLADCSRRKVILSQPFYFDEWFVGSMWR